MRILNITFVLFEQHLQLSYVSDVIYSYLITPESMSTNPLRNDLMLEVLAVARERMALASAELGALEYKIERVRRDMRYAPLLYSLKGANVAYGV